MGRDCWIVWRHDEKIDIEGIFEDREDALCYAERRESFVDCMIDPPSFHITVLEGGLYEQDTLP